MAHGLNQPVPAHPAVEVGEGTGLLQNTAHGKEWGVGSVAAVSHPAG